MLSAFEMVRSISNRTVHTLHLIESRGKTDSLHAHYFLYIEEVFKRSIIVGHINMFVDH